MTAPINIKDLDSNVTAKVTRFGQLVVAPIQYSTPVTDELDSINTAFNFITPQQGSLIVITDMIIAADKNVSPTDPAIVDIYTADSAESTTIIDSILEPLIGRGVTVPVTGLNLLVGEGVWVNAKTNDNVVKLTIMFYRIPVRNI